MKRGRLVDGHDFRLSVDGAAGGEHHIPDVKRTGHLQKCPQATHVVGRVHGWVSQAFFHGLVGCEVKDALDGIAGFGAIAKKRLQRRSVSHIDRMEGHLVVTEFPDPVDGLRL